MMTYTKGDTYSCNIRDTFTSGIDGHVVKGLCWHNCIECYANTKEEAEKMRDRILNFLTKEDQENG